MLEELRLLFHLFFVVVVTAYDRPYVQTQTWEVKSPVFAPTPDNYTYEAGKLARLKCEVQNLGKKRVGWRRASAPNPLTIGTMTFVEDDRISVEHPPSTGQWNLMIKRVEIEDAGVYECQVASTARHLRKHVLLVVKEPKIRENEHNIQITGEEFVEQGKKIYLICNATGKEHSPDDLDWFKNGNKLTTEFARKIYIRKFVSLTTKTIVSILEIKNAKLSDAGMYVCRTSDLQITSRRINVLKTNKENVKRGTPKDHSDSNSGRTLFGSCSTSLVLTLISLLTIRYRLEVMVLR
ncbi:polymeric immunoglobulin receptor-like isoform X2 [Haliotis rufescens]|uniref:polymeric immunoglobulin receptor-like isoform X2 n=1 Tax=Haliotis rufescens TaxID=6454 RepID=UPI001EB0577C|nr:polymeric immunoglobulin receptor-like isoform X2 [Haliotis rufescens]